MATPAVSFDPTSGLIPVQATPQAQVAASRENPNFDATAGLVDKDTGAPAQTTLQYLEEGGKNIAKGFVEGAGQTGNSMVHATDYLGNKIGDVLGLPGHASAQDIAGTAPAGTGGAAMTQLTTPTTTGEKIGVGAEGIAEFVLGDEALKSLSLGEKAIKAAKLAETYEKAGPAAKAAIEATLTAGRRFATGTAQGYAHGESTTQALESGATAAGAGAIAEGTGKATAMIENKIMEHLTDPLTKTPEAFTQLALKVGGRAAVGAAIYKLPIPEWLKGSLITGLGLHGYSNVAQLAEHPAVLEAAAKTAETVKIAAPYAAPVVAGAAPQVKKALEE